MTRITRREFGKTALFAAAGILIPSRADAMDSHAHVFERGLKLAASRRYAPDYDARPADYLRLLSEHGVARGALIQPSFLGTDNSYLCAALKAHPDRLRGVAVVDPGVRAEEMRQLEACGIVGIRLNLVGQELPPLASSAWRRLVADVSARGWHVEVHREARDLPRILDPLLEAGATVVVDHFGRPDPAMGVDDPGFRHLLSLGASRRVWVKLSGWYRNGGLVRGEEIAQRAIPLLRGSFGLERLVWGSDWPHTQFERVASYDAAVEALKRWLPESVDRKAVAGDAPRALFRL